MKQEWYKSWALWMALAALVVYVVKVVAKIDIAPAVDGLMDVLLPVLVGFGIVNNPNMANRLWDNNTGKDGAETDDRRE